MYILVEEYNNWADYIVRTSYELLKYSDNKIELEDYMNKYTESYQWEEESMIYYIQKVDKL